MVNIIITYWNSSTGKKEKQRLLNAIENTKARLIIIYGRRRCGKSTLIKNTLKPGDIYFMAQQSGASGYSRYCSG